MTPYKYIMAVMAHAVFLTLLLVVGCGQSPSNSTPAVVISTNAQKLGVRIPIVPADSAVAWSEKSVSNRGLVPGPSPVILRAHVILTAGGLQQLQQDFVWTSVDVEKSGISMVELQRSTGITGAIPKDGWMSSTSCERAIADKSVYHEATVLFHPTSGTLVIQAQHD